MLPTFSTTDVQNLKNFIHNFYGYGNYDAPYWFVGMEEACGDVSAEILCRLNTWVVRGSHQLEDLRDYHLDLVKCLTKSSVNQKIIDAISRLFPTAPVLPPTQTTWRGYIRVVFAKKKQPYSLDKASEYQRDHLGRWGNATCLLELLPLPSPGVGKWGYGDWDVHSATLGVSLKDRASYKSSIVPHRIQHIHSKILAHKPKVVCFFSLGYKSDWEKITGVPFVLNTKGYWECTLGSTECLMLKHPNARFEGAGAWDKYFGGI